MSQETWNFILGWLAGLIPSLITVYVGYRIQLKNDDRKRKADVLNRRLDQLESTADKYLEIIGEIDVFVGSAFDNTVKAGDIPAIAIPLIEKVRKLHNINNIFLVMNDMPLYKLAYEINSLMDSEANLLIQMIDMETLEIMRSREDIEQKQREINKSISLCNANIKARLDVIRASDPIEYYKNPASPIKT